MRVQEKGQVTLPQAIRKKLKLKQGDFVTFVETDEGVMIKRSTVLANETLDEISAALQAKGVTVEDLIESGCVIREQIARDKYGV